MPFKRLEGFLGMSGEKRPGRRLSGLVGGALVGGALVLVAAAPAGAVPPPLGPPVAIAYVERHVDHLPPLHNEDPIPDDLGAKGVDLSIKDSNLGGRFVGVALAAKSTVVAPDADIKAAVAAMLAKDKPRFLVVNAPAQDLLAIADMPEARDVLLLNIGASDTNLRDKDCRPNLLHTAASRAMLADTLMQFLTFKKWMRVLLVSGPHPEDKLYADALRHSIRKFGGKIVAETTYDAHGADIRDSALTEFVQVTRGPEHDVVAVADEANEFGASLVYNTDTPRPVVGTHGLTPTAWGRPVESWAAVQLQNRFFKLAGRHMQPTDYAGWLAVHAVGEAAVQLKSVDPEAIRKLLVSHKFEFGGYKGRSLSFRPWDGQLREPLFDLWSGAVVATAPLQGFLHPRTDLDTIGLDQPESACKTARG